MAGRLLVERQRRDRATAAAVATVTLVKSDRGWVLIARDAKALGYVAEAKLHKLN